MYEENGMDFMALSKLRHTVRKYAKKPVEQEKVKKILEAGRWAPTAVNAQPQRILILNTPDDLQKVKDFCTFGWKQQYVELAKESDTTDHKHIIIYYGAPLVLLVCYDKKACWKNPENGADSGQTDAAIVATHMMLEAVSLGLGTAWISYFDEQKIRKSLHLPDDWQPVCMLYIGYPADDYQPNEKLSTRRKPLTETCFATKSADNA